GSVVKKHPIVKGVSGTIPNANATIPINVHGGKMKTLAGQDGAILVGVATIGSGVVVYCGWDYYVSEEAHQRVLGNAVDWARARQTGGLFATPWAGGRRRSFSPRGRSKARDRGPRPHGAGAPRRVGRPGRASRLGLRAFRLGD